MATSFSLSIYLFCEFYMTSPAKQSTVYYHVVDPGCYDERLFFTLGTLNTAEKCRQQCVQSIPWAQVDTHSYRSEKFTEPTQDC